MKQLLSIEHRQVKPGIALIVVKGRLMLGEDSQQIDLIVAGLLEQGISHIVFDLEELTHIDSTGIGRFIASYNRILQVRGATLHMAAATGPVRSAFRVTKLDTVFPFFDTVDKAVAASVNPNRA